MSNACYPPVSLEETLATRRCAWAPLNERPLLYRHQVRHRQRDNQHLRSGPGRASRRRRADARTNSPLRLICCNIEDYSRVVAAAERYDRVGRQDRLGLTVRFPSLHGKARGAKIGGSPLWSALTERGGPQQRRGATKPPFSNRHLLSLVDAKQVAYATLDDIDILAGIEGETSSVVAGHRERVVAEPIVLIVDAENYGRARIQLPLVIDAGTSRPAEQCRAACSGKACARGPNQAVLRIGRTAESKEASPRVADGGCIPGVAI